MKPKAVADGIPVWCSHDEIVDLVKLIPNPRNPNHHPENQIDLGARIIKAHGWRWPIVVSKRSGFITKGHGRLLFAERMGVKEAPVDYQDYATEAEEWQDAIADNRLQEFAEPDLDLIKEIMEATEALDAELTGYNLDEFDPPNFDPASIDDQGRLDELKPIHCPQCGFTFVPEN